MSALARLAVIASLSFSLSGCATLFHLPPSTDTASVQPMQLNGQTFCTAFSINEAEGLWATARHCVEAGAQMRQMTNTAPTLWYDRYDVVYVDDVYDVAVIQADVRAPALQFAAVAPMVGDRVSVTGFPYGLRRLVRVSGTVAGRNVPLASTFPSDILDVTVAGGNSGSPVLNVDGALVGILWGKFTDSNHSISVPHHAVVRILTPFL